MLIVIGPSQPIPVNSMQTEITKILADLCSGDRKAADDVLVLLYEELRMLAANEMKRERPDHTLQPTALLHEAFMRMKNLRNINWRGREHFCGVAAGVMRRVLIDHARRKSTQKRGDGIPKIRLDDVPTPLSLHQQVDLLEVDEALNRLESLNPRHARVVELRVFAGLSIAETADLLEVSLTTVKDDWRMSRAWLKSQLRLSED